jgi:hypothetical protein
MNPRSERRALPTIPLVIDHAVRSPVEALLQNFPGAVGRTVIYHDYLFGLEWRCMDRRENLFERVDFIVARNNY